VQRSKASAPITSRLDRGIQGFIGAITQLLFNVLPAVVYLVISVVVMLRHFWRSRWSRRERVFLDRCARIDWRFYDVRSAIVTARSFAMDEIPKERFLREVAEAHAVVVTGGRADSGFGAAGNNSSLVAEALDSRGP